MKKNYYVLFVSIGLLCLLAPFSMRASHVMGADIQWKCVGGDTFEITVTAYRDCNGIALSGTDLTYFSTSPESCLGITTANTTKTGGKDITGVCPGYCDRCTDASCQFAFGIQSWTITATVVLPPPCCHYTIAWQECCRNGAITTGAAGQNFYSEVYMNTCIKPCVNSPYFSNPPVGIFCIDQCIYYNPAANDVSRDVNGAADSLVYSFAMPNSSPGNDIPYISGYTDSTPLVYTGTDPNAPFVPPYCLGFHLDPTNGDIQFRATKTDVTVFVIVVTAYRKDSLGIERVVAMTRRDLQISIIDCPANHPPIITGINGGTENSIKICADKQTCFTIKAFDLDPPDTDKLMWTDPGTMPGATFTVIKDGKKWPTALFCWTPTDAMVRSYPYSFVVQAVDNSCHPLPGRSSRAFSIYVIASPKAIYSAQVQNCGLVNFSASVSPASTTTISSYVWTGQGSPGYGPLYIAGRTGSYKYTRPGTYAYTLTVTGPNGCTRNYVDSVTIAPYCEILLPPDTTVCQSAPPITIQAHTKYAKSPYTISWDHSANTTGTLTAQITRDTVFVAHIKDATGCTNYDSMRVYMQPLPVPDIGPDQRGCWGHTVMLTTGLKKHMPYAAWTWIKGKDTVRNYLHGDTIYVADSGMYVVNVKDSFGCPGTDTVNVFFNPLVKANSGNKDVCFGNSIELHAGIGGSGASYLWIDRVHNRIISTDSTYTIANAIAPSYSYAVVITQSQHGVTCTDTGIMNVAMHPIPTPRLRPLFPPKCITDPAVNINTLVPAMVDAGHAGGTWYYPRKPDAVVNGFIFPSIMGRTDKDSTLGWIHYLYTDQFGCRSDDSARIVISNLPEVSAGPDTEICKANGLYLLSNAAVGPAPGTWYPLNGKNLTRSAPTPTAALVYKGDSLYFDPAAVGQDTVYGVVYSYVSPPASGKSQCSNTDTVFLTVKTNPVIHLTPVDSQCNNAAGVQLNASPQGGTWNFTDATAARALRYDKATNSYFFYPDSTVGGYHHLMYTAYADPGRRLCPSVDSMQIYVAPSPSKVDFATVDGRWQYCVSHSVEALVPTGNTGPGVGIGSFSSAPNPNLVYTSNGKWYFDPSKADTTDSTNNVITYTLPYNFGKCNISVSHMIGVDGRPFVHITSSPEVCSGPSSFEIKAIAGNVTRLTWTSDFGNNQFKDLNVPSNTDVLFYPTPQQLLSQYFNVYLEGANHGVCQADKVRDSFVVNPKPVVGFTSARSGCAPLGITFSSTATINGRGNGAGIKAYNWDFGDGSAHSALADPLHVFRVLNGQPTQQYTISFSATSDSGCVSDTVKQGWITVFASPKPAITANPQITSIALPEVQFDVNEALSRGIDFADAGTSYHWDFGDNNHGYASIKNPQYTYSDTGKFKVTVEVRSRGCLGDSSLEVYIQPELIIYIPNVFTPGGETGSGKMHEQNYFSITENNTFQPVISDYSTFEMSIYNRWGELMYTTDNPNKGWDGRFNNHPPKQDVYVYVIKAAGYSGKLYTFTGTVTLLY